MKRILPLLILASLFTSAQANYVQKINIGTYQGLSCDAIKSFDTDYFGRLWVGTENGVNLITNGQINKLRYFNVDDHSLVVNNVVDIACAKHTIIASNHHLLDYNPDNETTHIITYQDNSVRTNNLLAVGDTIYFYNTPLSALMMYDINTRTTKIQSKFPPERMYHFDKLFHIQERNILLLIEETRGFYTLDIISGKLTHLEELGTDININATFIDSNDILWVAYKDRGITGYYIRTGFDQIAHFDTSNSEITDNNVTTMAEMSDGHLLIGTSNSVYVLHRRSGQIQNSPFQRVDDINSICSYVDKNANKVFLGTVSQGIYILQQSFYHSINNINHQKGSQGTFIPISSFQESDGTMWIGTKDKGLLRFDEESEIGTPIPSTMGMRISSICSYDYDHLLFVESSNGLFKYNKKNGTVTPARTLIEESPDVISSKNLYQELANTPDGDVLIFNYNGRHLLLHHETGEIDEIILELNGERNTSIVRDVKIQPTHALIECNNCIYEIDYKTLLARLIYQRESINQHRIMHTTQDSHGKIWICSPNDIISYDPKTKENTLIYNNPPNDMIINMTIDHHDRLWLTTEKSLILMIDTKSNKVVDPYPYTYYTKNCEETPNFSIYFSLVSQEELIYFSHSTGMVVINPAYMDIETKEVISNIYLTNVNIDNQHFIPEESTYSKPIKLSNRFNKMDLTIVPDKQNPTKTITMKYVVMKKGMNEPFIEEISNNTQFTIYNTSSGSFTLLASSLTSRGWSEPQKILSYTVAKPFLLTAPSFLMVLVIIISLSITISKLGNSMRQIDIDKILSKDKEQQTIKDINKDKTITQLSNLAHELKTPLSIIFNPIKDMIEEDQHTGVDKERLERIYDQVNKMTDMVNQILDNRNEGNNISNITNKQIESTSSQEMRVDKPIAQPSVLSTKATVANEVQTVAMELDKMDNIPAVEEIDFDTKSHTLLIVDDQTDILQFIKEEYSPLFKTIYTAHNGKEALDIVRQRIPSVVVSDIMMPIMNGFELCRTIKTDLELSSIPVILLTSRSDPRNQDMGYKMGADSFIPKPFDAKLLYKIIRSQLKNRFDIKRQYASSLFTTISEDQTFSAADEQFILKLNKFIRTNMSNTLLGVDMVVEHMNVSRTTLFNKMNNIIGVSTNKYIRRIRIETAKELLTKTNKSVGAIAEETGFSESQYFSTVFRQETGMTPSQFKSSLKESSANDNNK